MRNLKDILEASLLDIEDTLSKGDEIFKNLEVDLKNINKGLKNPTTWYEEFNYYGSSLKYYIMWRYTYNLYPSTVKLITGIDTKEEEYHFEFQIGYSNAGNPAMIWSIGLVDLMGNVVWGYSSNMIKKDLNIPPDEKDQLRKKALAPMINKYLKPIFKDLESIKEFYKKNKR